MWTTTDGLTSFARTTLYILEAEARRVDEVSEFEQKVMNRLVEVLREKGPMSRSALTHQLAPDYRSYVAKVLPKLEHRKVVGIVGEYKARNGRVIPLWGLFDERAD